MKMRMRMRKTKKNRRTTVIIMNNILLNKAIAGQIKKSMIRGGLIGNTIRDSNNKERKQRLKEKKNMSGNKEKLRREGNRSGDRIRTIKIVKVRIKQTTQIGKMKKVRVASRRKRKNKMMKEQEK
jgi:hypothetical protein